MKKLLQLLFIVIALVAAVLGLTLLCKEKKKDDEYLTLYDDSHPCTGN